MGRGNGRIHATTHHVDARATARRPPSHDKNYSKKGALPLHSHCHSAGCRPPRHRQTARRAARLLVCEPSELPIPPARAAAAAACRQTQHADPKAIISAITARIRPLHGAALTRLWPHPLVRSPTTSRNSPIMASELNDDDLVDYEEVRAWAQGGARRAGEGGSVGRGRGRAPHQRHSTVTPAPPRRSTDRPSAGTIR